MFWILQVSKIQDGGQNGCRFPISIINFQPFKLKTQGIQTYVLRYELYTVNIITTFQLLQESWNPKWPLFGVQDGIQNGRHFRILIIIYQPYTLETQVRYPNICFEV